MRRVRYLVRINKDPRSDWGASVPDLPACVATGKTIAAALRRIQGAIELHLRGIQHEGRWCPASPSPAAHGDAPQDEAPSRLLKECAWLNEGWKPQVSQSP